MKRCSKCKELKSKELFHKSSREKDGLQYHCKACQKSASIFRRSCSETKEKDRGVAVARRSTQEGKEYTKNYYLKYNRSKRGYLINKYSDMKRRIEGRGLDISKKYYEGLEICSLDEFLGWSLHQESFHLLWYEWLDGGQERGNCPSIDRVDSLKGYTLDNMQYLSLADNIRKAVKLRERRKNHAPTI